MCNYCLINDDGCTFFEKELLFPHFQNILKFENLKIKIVVVLLTINITYTYYEEKCDPNTFLSLSTMPRYSRQTPSQYLSIKTILHYKNLSE